MPAPSYLLKPLIFAISILMIEWGIFPTLFVFIAFLSFLSGAKFSRSCLKLKPSPSLSIITISVVLISALIGFFTKTLNFISPWWYVPYSLVWVIFQEFIIFCFIFENFEQAFAGKHTAVFLTATTFAVFHLPNPFLVPATFIMNLIFSGYYRRHRSILLPGLLHFVLAIAAFTFLPFSLTHQLKVGIQCCR